MVEGEGGSTTRLVLLAGERGDEQAAGLAASLWAARGHLITVLSHSGQHMVELLELAKELVGQEGLEPSFLGDWIQVPSPLLNFLRNNIFKQTINLKK